jgi:hypothetical protein
MSREIAEAACGILSKLGSCYMLPHSMNGWQIFTGLYPKAVVIRFDTLFIISETCRILR